MTRITVPRLLRLVPLLLAGVLVLGASGCMFRTQTPIPVVRHPAPNSDAPRKLFVLLPGRGDTPEHFQRNGIVDALQRAMPGADVAAVAANLGYYMRGNFRTRVWEDVLGPAQASDYEEIWLVGISLGGAGAMGLTWSHPESVTGIVLLAPFLGGGTLLREIERAGGVGAWEPAQDDDDPLVDLWRLARRYEAKGQGELPRIYLGYGRSDYMRRGHRLLASVLPPAQVARVDGGHRWSVWRRLMHQLIPRIARSAR